MSLLGFKAQNHPQQTLPAGPLDDVDEAVLLFTKALLDKHPEGGR